MEHEHRLRTLTERENGYIGYCAGCQSYNVAYKNSLFVLQESEFSCYRQVLVSRVGMRPFFTTHGKEWLLKTPMLNYFLLLTDEEIDEVVAMMDEASLLREVAQILQTPIEKKRHEDL
ncbi:DUF6686 family protein [Tellurirhabdus bombi]|uniref:DUF6686 family protein n=1 Tax=Tellurirhabdus bombi TaxID=2907205 RepID=UPI001F28BBCF|nr:DUF6686 family protein [Tellurirhabdus bombi]